MATVKNIVREYLRKNGYGGLFSPEGECFCEVGDLMHCEGNGEFEEDMVVLCEAGYLHKSEYCIGIQRDKPKEDE